VFRTYSRIIFRRKTAINLRRLSPRFRVTCIQSKYYKPPSVRGYEIFFPFVNCFVLKMFRPNNYCRAGRLLTSLLTTCCRYSRHESCQYLAVSLSSAAADEQLNGSAAVCSWCRRNGGKRVEYGTDDVMVGEVRGDPLRNWVTGSVDPDTPAI